MTRGRGFSIEEAKEWLMLWPLWIMVASVVYLTVMMILYPHAGLILAAFGIIASSNIANHPARVILTFVLVCLLLWSTQQMGSTVLVDDPLPDEEQATYGYGPTARP